MAIDTITIAEFVKTYHIRMTAMRAQSNPNMPDSSSMNHWKCILRRPSHTLTVFFSMGLGHNGKEPAAEDVLDCLASNAASIDNARGFEDWCADFGYDTDSRKAENTFKTCEHQASRLKTFLESHLYNELLYSTERQ
jgi:hypothetical protein